MHTDHTCTLKILKSMSKFDTTLFKKTNTQNTVVWIAQLCRSWLPKGKVT